MELYPAIQGVGQNVLFIRDNKVVGIGRSQIMHGDDFVGITCVDDAAKALVSEDKEAIELLTYKHMYLSYSPITGMFIETRWMNEALDEKLEDTRVVDEFNFRWGMVPDSFKDVEGYRSAPSSGGEVCPTCGSLSDCAC